jgi:hypothetical protein
MRRMTVTRVHDTSPGRRAYSAAPTKKPAPARRQLASVLTKPREMMCRMKAASAACPMRSARATPPQVRRSWVDQPVTSPLRRRKSVRGEQRHRHCTSTKVVSSENALERPSDARGSPHAAFHLLQCSEGHGLGRLCRSLWRLLRARPRRRRGRSPRPSRGSPRRPPGRSTVVTFPARLNAPLDRLRAAGGRLRTHS